MKINKLDEYISAMWELSKDNAKGVINPGIKIVALIIDKKGDIILKRRNTATGGNKNSESHAETLCIKSKHYPEKGVVKSIYVTIPPCEDCRQLIDEENIRNVYYLFDYYNQANRPWNKDNGRARVKQVPKESLNMTSLKYIEELERLFTKNNVEAKKIPRPKKLPTP